MPHKNLPDLLLSFLFPVIFLLAACQKKDDHTPPEEIENTTNGKTEAVFNPALSYETLIDQEGNAYKTIQIGNQVWMAENLRTTRYNDGTPIPLRQGFALTAAYSNWENTTDDSRVATFGRFYNRSAVMSGKLAPQGWRIPTWADWEELLAHLGGMEAAGGKLREAGILHWASPNTAASNESGFTALGAGIQMVDAFPGLGAYSRFWSVSRHPTISDATRLLELNYNKAEAKASLTIDGAGYGHSVRCIKAE